MTTSKTAADKTAADKKGTSERPRFIEAIGISLPTRHDIGDVASLTASMALEGLRHPVLVLPSGQLLKGLRRITAAQLLGWTSIPARTVDTIEDAVEAIIKQRDDLTKTRSIAELVDLGMTMEILDRRVRGIRGTSTYDNHQVIGPAVTSSGTTYKRARALLQASRSQARPAHVVSVAQDALRQADAGTITISAAYERMKLAEKASPVDGLGPDGLPLIAPPVGNARTPKARQLREIWIRALAAKGASREQIAGKLDISTAGMKKILTEMGFVIPADAAMSKTQRKAVDPNRAMHVSLTDLDALVWSLDRIPPASLDPEHAVEWAAQLKTYAQAIGHVSRKITKEYVR